MPEIKWISTTQDCQWKEMQVEYSDASLDTLELTGGEYQHIDGFGGCFNELGWSALENIEVSSRKELLEELFHPDKGLKFKLCRLPIGASDYALEWYSLNENAGDYKMENFSINRDKKYLIPYIKAALEYNKDLKLFASPWSPPTWMKSPRAYNFGTLVWTKENLEAYALYFKKFVEAYKEEGVSINQIHVQNEVIADQKFPSCVWKGEQLKEFIKDYMGPLFEKNKLDTEIWLGTINAPESEDRALYTGYDDYANLVLVDAEARRYISGVSYQWAGKHAIQQTYMSWPEIKLMQSENECGNGQNTWQYARYIFNLFRHYLTNGANSYIYWNMILEPEGKSTWGWKQNAMITIDPEKKSVIYNPEFYVMKHYSHFIDEGAVRLGVKGHWAGNATAFRNPDGRTVVVVGNGLDIARKLTIKTSQGYITGELLPQSFNTFVI